MDLSELESVLPDCRDGRLSKWSSGDSLHLESVLVEALQSHRRKCCVSVPARDVHLERVLE